MKKRISLSPFWYVTSRKRLLSSIAYMRSTAADDHPLDRLLRPAVLAGLVVGDREVGGEVLAEDLGRALLVGPLDLDLHVEATRPQDRGVDEVLAVRGADHDHVLQALDAVDLGQQLRHDRALDVGRDAGAAGAEQGVHLVEEHDDGDALLRLLPGPLEDEADLTLGLPHVLVEELGALDVEEERRGRSCRRSARSPAARASWRRPWR